VAGPRFGIAGCGNMGRRHATTLVEAAGATVAGVTDADPGAASALAARALLACAGAQAGEYVGGVRVERARVQVDRRRRAEASAEGDERALTQLRPVVPGGEPLAFRS
jgi:hypothetical protein